MHQFEGTFLFWCQMNFHGCKHDRIWRRNQASSMAIGIDCFCINSMSNFRSAIFIYFLIPKTNHHSNTNWRSSCGSNNVTCIPTKRTPLPSRREFHVSLAIKSRSPKSKIGYICSCVVK